MNLIKSCVVREWSKDAHWTTECTIQHQLVKPYEVRDTFERMGLCGTPVQYLHWIRAEFRSTAGAQSNPNQDR